MSEKQEDCTSISPLVKVSTDSISSDLLTTESHLSNQTAESTLVSLKRNNPDNINELYSTSENLPVAFPVKRQKLMPETACVQTSSDCLADLILSSSKRTSMSCSNSSNLPLCERNIRLENDSNSTVRMNFENKNSRILDENQAEKEDTKDSASVNENGKGVTSCVNSNTFVDNVNNNENDSRKLENVLISNTIPELPPTTLSSAISTLDSQLSQHSPSSSTLHYIARLPDGCPRQAVEGLEDVSATPPHYPHHPTPLHQASYSGDEDDDNYLDSSEDEDGAGEGAGNIDEEESCGEDDGSVVSTVGSTCSLRSVASEALAAICRNEQGQAINQDGSLLYSSAPSPQPLPAFSASLFSHVPPAIRFCQHNEVCRPLPECVGKLLKWRHTPITPLIIRKTVANSGYKMTKRTILWSGTWGKHMKSTCYKSVKSYQKVNHFPGTFQIGRKDKLWNNFLRLQSKFGKEEFGFMPKTFVLPAELSALKTAFDKEGVKKKWIVKPPASARGTGIQVVDKWSQLDTDSQLVVQRYVSRPYLINNTKFDLRIYVAVTSFHPLRIYLYNDGLVRFASVEYRNESTSLSDRFMHLTNYSVNKSSSSYTTNAEAGECQGHRWTLWTLWAYLKPLGVDTGALWSRVADMVIKTIMSGEHDIIIRAKKNLRSKYSSYELFGFDVLLDEKLRPWLLEVNISPSLHSACSLDYKVKGPLMSSLLTMASFHVPDHRSLTSQMQHEVLSEYGLSERVSRLTLDHRLYTRLLTDVDQRKHAAVNAMPRSQYLTAALESLTPDDVRHLVLGEDELNRAGSFTCIFPTSETHHYFGFFDKPRYYNRLWDAWETAYGSCRQKGIDRLEELCSAKYHLIVPPKFKMPKVTLTILYILLSRENSIALTPSTSSNGTCLETATTTITSVLDQALTTTAIVNTTSNGNAV
ncbi:Tubulin-tyrosine ligase/Tubulin polyglutamylase, partial [Trinorchestia longiramus]